MTVGCSERPSALCCTSCIEGRIKQANTSHSLRHDTSDCQGRLACRARVFVSATTLLRRISEAAARTPSVFSRWPRDNARRSIALILTSLAWKFDLSGRYMSPYSCELSFKLRHLPRQASAVLVNSDRSRWTRTRLPEKLEE